MILSFLFFEKEHITNKATITLLTVSLDSHLGGAAELSIYITPGQGRIFVNTFPIPNIDTIESIRMAQREACRLTTKDCNNYDFYYELQVQSPFVSGPSAGAMIAATTLAMLEGKNIDNKVTMTGTVMPGGVIGPISGVIEKSIAAKNYGKRVVMIPYLNIFNLPSSNASNNLNESSQSTDNITIQNSSEIFPIPISNGTTLPFNYTPFYNSTNLTINRSIFNVSDIHIIPVENIIEAYEIITGEKFLSPHLLVPKEYYLAMEKIASNICNRSSHLINLINATEVLQNLGENESLLFQSAYKKYNQSLNVSEPYTKASLCFSSNILLRKLLLLDKYKFYEGIQNASAIFFYSLNTEIMNNISSLEKEINDYINPKHITHAQLETIMIIKDRLYEAKKSLNECNDTPCIDQLSYAIERLESAKNWLHMYSIKDTVISLDLKYIKQLAVEKINEGQEKVEFLYLISNRQLDTTQINEKLNEARSFLEEDPLLALYIAIEANGDINLLLSLRGIDVRLLPILLEEKINVAKSLISLKQRESIFSHIAYNYLTYSQYFKHKQDVFGALIYAEYAIAFSSLDLKSKETIETKNNKLLIILILFFILIILFFVLKRIENKIHRLENLLKNTEKNQIAITKPNKHIRKIKKVSTTSTRARGRSKSRSKRGKKK